MSTNWLLPVTRVGEWLLFGGLATFLLGCSSSAVEFGEVQGQVTFEGKPLANLLVTFAPQSPSPTSPAPISTAVTDAEGRFQLQAATGINGAAVGKHRVVIEDLNSAMTGLVGNSREDQDEKPPLSSPSPSRIPQRYSTAASTPLWEEVNPQLNQVHIDLKP